MTASDAFGQVLGCLVSARWRDLRINASVGHPLCEGITETQRAVLQARAALRDCLGGVVAVVEARGPVDGRRPRVTRGAGPRAQAAHERELHLSGKTHREL